MTSRDRADVAAARVQNVGFNVGGRPDGYLVDFFWESIQLSLEREGGGAAPTSVPLVAPALSEAAPAVPGGAPPPLLRTGSRVAMPMDVDTRRAISADLVPISP